MIVVKIGGCNGSGKTSVARAIIENNECEPRPQQPTTKVLYYTGKSEHGRLVVLGSYAKTCGGMDTITDKDLRLSLIKQHAVGGNIVVFEGLVASKAYGPTGELAKSKGHFGRWLYAFMDTPFDVCVERVLARRKAAGNDKPFDPERTMRETYHVYEMRQKAARADGHRVLMLDHRKSPKQLAKLLMAEAAKLGAKS